MIINAEELYKRFGNKTEMVDCIIESWLENEENLIEELDNDIANNDFKLFANHVHSIKGNAATISAESIHNIATNMDQFCKQNKWKEAIDLLPELKNSFFITKKFLSENKHKENSYLKS